MASEKESITFKQQYISCVTWQDKCVVVALYHKLMCVKYPNWTIRHTAEYFDISNGLVSENVRLADAVNDGNDIIQHCKTREEGLKLIERRKHKRIRAAPIMFKLEIDKDKK